MAIKVNNTEAIGDDKKSNFQMLSLDSYTKEQLNALVVVGTEVGDAVWNSSTQKLSFWNGEVWVGAGGGGIVTVQWYDIDNVLKETTDYDYQGDTDITIAFQKPGFYKVSTGIVAPFSARMFVYGAGGGGGGGIAGAGGGVTGEYTFSARSSFVVTVGERGLDTNVRNAFPDGGLSSNAGYQEGGGGGGTKISKSDMGFYELQNIENKPKWILVGGGGGGGSNYQTSGSPLSAGGETGQPGGYYYPSDGSAARGGGATQTAGGAAGTGGRVGGGNAGQFAKGGNGKGGAGGGGYYGGGGAAGYYAQGGGGSSYRDPDVYAATFYNGSGRYRHPHVATQLSGLSASNIPVLTPGAGNQNQPGVAIITLLAQ